MSPGFCTNWTSTPFAAPPSGAGSNGLVAASCSVKICGGPTVVTAPGGIEIDWRIIRSSIEASRLRSSSVIRSEEHTSELQSLMRISYAVFCLKKQNKKQHQPH